MPTAGYPNAEIQGFGALQPVLIRAIEDMDLISRRLNMSTTKNKTDLIESVSAKSGLSKADATKAVDAVFATVTDTLKDGDALAILGFGKFSASHKEASKARNPATGAEIDVPARNVPKFTAGKGLKDALNG
jgi:DNA-binding protein HU-beta